MTDKKSKYECYLNITKVDGSIGTKNVIIYGVGETAEEAQELFDHSIATMLEAIRHLEA